MSKPKPEIEYPISPNVLIDYIKNTSVYPVCMGSDFISFSIEPFMGGKIPPNISIHYNKTLTKSEVESILGHLNLRIGEFEEYLSNSDENIIFGVNSI